MNQKIKKPIVTGVLMIVLGILFLYLTVAVTNTYSMREYLSLAFSTSLVLSGLLISMGKMIGAYLSILFPVLALATSYIATDGDVKQILIKSAFWLVLAAYILSPKIRSRLV